jgi:F420-0:gamma-glutamyl ligase-like protein
MENEEVVGLVAGILIVGACLSVAITREVKEQKELKLARLAAGESRYERKSVRLLDIFNFKNYPSSGYTTGPRF